MPRRARVFSNPPRAPPGGRGRAAEGRGSPGRGRGAGRGGGRGGWAEAGLTTREACGNTVRNVTSCPLAGVCPTESFDVTPYALATSRFFMRHPDFHDMPRKFKIAFSGCEDDGNCAVAGIQSAGYTVAL